MRSTRSDGLETRRRILDTAGEVFAETGYAEGTVARIREAAGVNQAAVNYHFGGKQQLYREVWDHAREEAERVYPIETPPGGSAEERLRVFLRHHVYRVLDEGPAGRFFKILAHEIHDRRPVLAEKLREDWNRSSRVFESILRDFVGPGITDSEVELCRLTILAPCFGLGMRLHKERKKRAVHESPPRFQPEILADHIFRFARAGLLDLKERAAERSAAAAERTAV